MSKTAAKFILVRLGMVLFGLAVALLIVELPLRFVPPPLPLEYLRGLHEVRRDRPWLFGLRPGARGRLCCSAVEYVINADGFRGRRYPRPKVPGTFRILVLWDAVASGSGVAQR